MRKSAAIIRKLPEQELAIHRLCRLDADFGGICEDYEAAAAALCHWDEAGMGYEARAHEYRQIMSGLEAEIVAALKLNRHMSRHTMTEPAPHLASVACAASTKVPNRKQEIDR